MYRAGRKSLKALPLNVRSGSVVSRVGNIDKGDKGGMEEGGKEEGDKETKEARKREVLEA